MATTEFLLVLLSGVVIGLLLGTSLRWIGGKFLSGNNQKEGGGTDRTKKISEEIHLH